MLRPQVEHGLQIVAAEGLKRDKCPCIDDPRKRGDAAGDHIGQLVLLADPDDRNQVGFAGDRVDLGDAFDIGEFAGQISDAARFRVDQDEGVNHGLHDRPHPAQATAPTGVSVAAVTPVTSERYRCEACGNVTRFDVTVTRRTRAFHHYTVGGDLSVDEELVLSEQVDEVSCRWCGSGQAVETVADQTNQAEEQEGSEV
ncbi:MAG: hypothetical protein QOF81_1916 [Acidimicrobiaceae bacterium]|nr:hypothetical protein [Acidimicrobiaceae bacterium]